MKVLVIGGTSLVGPCLLQELLQMGCDVATVTRRGEAYFCEETYKGDRLDRDFLKNVLSSFRPDCVVDMIALKQDHVLVLLSIFDELKLAPHLIVISSIDVYAAYGKLHKTELVEYQSCPLTEVSPLRSGLGVEGCSYDKLNIEKICLSHYNYLTVLRLPAIYGWPETTRIDSYLDAMLKGVAEIEISEKHAQWRFSRCLHRNAAYAISLCVSQPVLGCYVYNVAEPEAFSHLDWSKKIAAAIGWKGRFKLTLDQIDSPDYSQDFFVSSQKIRKEKNFFEKYNPAEGLLEAVRFYNFQRLNRTYHKLY